MTTHNLTHGQRVEGGKAENGTPLVDDQRLAAILEASSAAGAFDARRMAWLHGQDPEHLQLREAWVRRLKCERNVQSLLTPIAERRGVEGIDAATSANMTGRLNWRFDYPIFIEAIVVVFRGVVLDPAAVPSAIFQTSVQPEDYVEVQMVKGRSENNIPEFMPASAVFSTPRSLGCGTPWQVLPFLNATVDVTVPFRVSDAVQSAESLSIIIQGQMVVEG